MFRAHTSFDKFQGHKLHPRRYSARVLLLAKTRKTRKSRTDHVAQCVTRFIVHYRDTPRS